MARENQGYKEAQCFEEWSLLEDQWHFDAQNGVPSRNSGRVSVPACILGPWHL